jgi:hypothetical protein
MSNTPPPPPPEPNQAPYIEPANRVYPYPPFSGTSTATVLQPLKPGESRPASAPRRGRPRTKVQPADLSSGLGAVFPDASLRTAASTPGAQQRIAPAPPGAKVESESEKKARLKQQYVKHVDELQKKIVTEFNDQLLQALMVVGIPGSFLYKDGSIPAKALKDSIYTPLGQALTINAYQADWIAHGICEVEKAEWVKKLNLTFDPDKPSYFWIGMGGLGAISYIGGMISAVTEMRKMVTELKNLQKMQSMGPQPEPEYNGPAFSEQGPF